MGGPSMAHPFFSPGPPRLVGPLRLKGPLSPEQKALNDRVGNHFKCMESV